MRSSEVLSLRAGKRALALLRERGLSPSDVVAIPAAAGGPKGLGLLELDKFIFGQWLRGQPTHNGQPRLLAGASIGAWRMAAATQQYPVAALERLCEAYLTQRYSAKPSLQEVSTQCGAIIDAFLDPGLLVSRDLGLAIVTSRGRGLLGSHHSSLRFALAASANLASRKWLGRFFERVVFRAASASACAPFDAFGWAPAVLSARNIRSALLASASIPTVTEPVQDIPDAPPGLYWDGGLIDYHFAWPWSRLDGLVLFPHFTDRIVPGWLDKSLPWRRAGGEAMSNVLLVAPSERFLASLPLKRLPERKDFYQFIGQDTQRIAKWRATVKCCAQLADAFNDFCLRPVIDQIRPL